MIVFEHNHVKKAYPVVLTTTNEYGPLLDEAEIRRCFTGVQELRSGSLDEFFEVIRFCSNGTHSLHTIENQTLSRENGLGTPLHHESDIPLRRAIAVVFSRCHPEVCVYSVENCIGEFDSSQNAWLLYKKPGFALRIGRD
jgi:hypothetical protein